MNLFRKISDGTYPVGEKFIRDTNPTVSFPEVFDNATALEFGYEVVYQVPVPTTKRWQMVRELAPVKSDKGFWEQKFEVVDMPFNAVMDSNGNEIKSSDQVQHDYLNLWKEELKKTVTDRRYSVETSGITLPNGVKIKTDRESQAQLSSAYSSLKNGLITDTQWKGDNGEWVLVTLTEIEPIAQAVAAHVRACFAAEKQHFESIDAITTFEGLDQYNTNTGWPA